MNLDQTLPLLANSLLDKGERLVGCCAASWQKTFTGRMVAIAISDSRIVIQPVDRTFAPDGEPISLTPDRIQSAKVSGGGRGGMLAEQVIMDEASIAATIRTTDGLTLKLMMMRAEGVLRGLGGGEVQRAGVASLLERLA